MGFLFWNFDRLPVSARRLQRYGGTAGQGNDATTEKTSPEAANPTPGSLPDTEESASPAPSNASDAGRVSPAESRRVADCWTVVGPFWGWDGQGFKLDWLSPRFRNPRLFGSPEKI